jgi:hypothetical protein
MAETQEKGTETNNAGAEPHVNTIDPSALAGTENSLGAESVRDGRPSTDDSVVEAMDEEGPDVSVPMAKDEGSQSR